MLRKHQIPFDLFLLALPDAASKAETLDAFLREGRIEAGLSAFAAPSDNVGLFSFAVLQVLDGLQHFSALLNQARDEFRAMVS